MKTTSRPRPSQLRILSKRRRPAPGVGVGVSSESDGEGRVTVCSDMFVFLSHGEGKDSLCGRFGTDELFADVTVAEDEDAVADFGDLLELARDEDRRDAVVGEFADELVDLGLGVEVHAAGGLVEQ